MIFDAQLLGPWVGARCGFRYIPGSASAIGRIRNGRIVAGVLYMDFNGVNVFCHIASEGNNWLTRAYLSIIFDYPFRQLKARRITVCVASTNAQSMRFVQHLGFDQEAILRGAHPGGDLIVFAMTAEKCRWIRELPYEKLAA